MARKNRNEDNVTPISKGSGPISDDKLKKVDSQYRKLKAEADKPRGEMGALLKQFEEDGGHKKAFKIASWMSGQEPSVAQDFLRSLNHYVDVFGINDQADWVDQAQAAE